jgi:uncharacterized membrane protein (GlpM family)
MNLSKYYVYFLAGLTVLLLVLQYQLRSMLPANTVYIVPAFCLITYFSHVLLMRSVTRESARFAPFFMMAIGFKMLAYLFFLAIMHYLTGGISLEFVMTFVVVYLVFTSFEMVVVVGIGRTRRNG